MSATRLLACALGAGAAISVGGCAQPLSAEWDDPLFRRVVARAGSQPVFGDASPASIAEHAVAPAAPIDPLMIDDAVRFAVGNHPELRRAAHTVRAADGRVVQAGRFPNPSVGLEIEALGSDAGEGGETSLVFEQPIPGAGARRKAREVAEADRRLARAAFRIAAHEVATRARIAFVRAHIAERRVEALESLRAVAEDLLAAAEARADAGAATESERLRARVVRDQAALDAAAARTMRARARRALGAAMGLEHEADIAIVADLDEIPDLPPREDAIALTLAHNASADRARIMIERAMRAHALAQAQAAPGFSISAGPRYSDPDNETTLDVGVGLEIPLFDRNRGEIAARLAERISAGAAHEATRLQLIDAVVDAWADYDASRLAAEAYAATLLPTAEQTLGLAREAYEAGKTDYLSLLDAQQALVRLRLARLDALETLHEAAATLEGIMQTHEPWADPPAANTGSLTP